MTKLSDLNKPLYNQDFATFNIRVKVIKDIFCYIPDEEEGLKIKFVGADETVLASSSKNSWNINNIKRWGKFHANFHWETATVVKLS